MDTHFLLQEIRSKKASIGVIGLGYVGLHYMNYNRDYKSSDYSNSYTDEGSMIESGVLLDLNDFVYLDFGINYETYNDYEYGTTWNYLFFDVGVIAFIK